MKDTNGQPGVQFAIPAPYRRATGGEAVVQVNAASVGDAVAALRVRYPDMAARLVTESGDLNPFVNVYLNGARLHGTNALDRSLSEGDRLVIMPVIGGGH